MDRIINKFIAIAIAVAGVFGAYSCVQAELQEMPEFITGVNVSIETPGIFELDEIATKVNYSVSGSNVIPSWSGEDDILGIYPIGGEQVAFPMSSSSGTMSAKFDGGAWALRTNYTYAAYFPFSPDYYNISETELPVSYLGQKQNGDNDLSHLGRYSFMTTSASNPDATGNIDFTLKQVGTWVQLRAVLPEGMNVGKATLIDNSSDLIVGGTLDLNQNASSGTFVPVLNNPVYSSSIALETEEFVAGADPVKFWMMLPPQNLTGHDLTLAVTSSGGNTTVEASMTGKEIVRNKPVVFNFGDASSDYKPDYLCVAAETAGVSVQFKLESESDAWASSSTVFDLEYSMDGENWNTCFFNRNYTLTNVGDKIYFRGDNDSFSVVPDQYIHFVTTGPVAVSGNIMTLLDKSGLSETIPGEYTFINLFRDAAITSAPSLPATTLAGSCYYGMFSGCTLLEKAPSLPATTLAEYCYSAMFSGCTALTEAPVLPATTLADGCYQEMFAGCSSLEKSPALPAMTLAQQCYSSMFGGCTSLKEAPALPATTLATSCYMAMFARCTSLSTAPVLPATTLANLCYLSMFVECSSLSRIEVAFSEWVGSILPTSSWCFSVPPGGTFVCPSDLDIKFGEGFIPEGWSVQYSDESTTTPDYLCFTAEMPNSTVGMQVIGNNWTLPVLQYSTDMKSWKAFNIGSTTITLPHIGDKVYFRGDNSSFSVSRSENVRFAMTGKIAASGNIMTLVDKSGRSRTIPNDFAFVGLFDGCSSLTKAPSLPATSLMDYSYQCMFENCTSLTAAPELPATELADGCYAAMFNGCISLTEAPELPATTLKQSCYILLFQNCTSLRKVKVSFTDWNESGASTRGWLSNVAPSGEFIAPDTLPAIYDDDHIPSNWAPDYLCFTAVDSGVTVSMSSSNSGWTLPTLEYSTDRAHWSPFVIGTTTVTLANSGDKVYFRGDNDTFSVSANTGYVSFVLNGKTAASGNIMSLVDKTCKSTTIPNASAFSGLFRNCSSLETAPELPATTLTENCYTSMFNGCTSLTEAPALPATTLADMCYYSMFFRCTSLTEAPALPATTLAGYCYSQMFYGCSALTEAPVLPAATLGIECYCLMFKGCTSLNRIEVAFTYWYPDNPVTTSWLEGVSSTGTFVCPSLLDTRFGVDFIPEGWTLQDSDPASATRDYLQLYSNDTNTTISMEVVGDDWELPSLEYSLDHVNWKAFIPGSTTVTLPNIYDKVYFRGNNDTFSVSDSKYVRFVMSSNSSIGGDIYANGNVMSLVDKTCTSKVVPNNYAFTHLFENCSILEYVENSLLPATTLTEGCYSYMFSDCDMLRNSPQLPAMTLAKSCYKDMFFHSGIAHEPSLPATTLAEACYDSMFLSCDNLTSAPSLPAMTLAKGCYASMFAYCYGLETAPALPATTLAESCYASMFNSCGLTSAPALPATTLAESCYENMFMSCSGLTSAPSLPATTMAKRSYYAMFYSCNNLASAPALPATTLAEYCYSEMFFACTSLTAAPSLPAPRFAEGCYDWMFYNCTALESAGINATGRLPKNCCSFMFYGCSSLRIIGVAFERWDVTEGMDNATYKWVDGVHATGTFVCPLDLPTSVRDENHIPLNWSIVHPRN